MTNPVLIEVTRGKIVESVHRGSVCVVDGDGKIVFERGDIEKPVFPRSAIKAIQALPFVESGAADAFGFGDKELSIACASHSGEPAHADLVRSMIVRAGLQETCLECGGHWSISQPALIEQTGIYDATPPAICNNCSGKHAGFVCTAAHLGIDTTGYVSPDHPVQEGVRRAMEEMTDTPHVKAHMGIDGCSIPTYAIALRAMAHGFAKMATGTGLSSDRASAAKRLLKACMAEPFYMAGTGRFCTDYMTMGGGRLFAKTGAEGVFCAAIPELGIGIALKIDDGGTRAAEVAMAAVTRHCLPKDDTLQDSLTAMSNLTLTNWNGLVVGSVREAVTN